MFSSDSTDQNLSEAFRGYEQEPVGQLAVGSPGKDGVVEITFTRNDDGNTNVSHEYARAPFHLMGGLHHDEELEDLATIYIQNPSGGVTQGDRQRMTVNVQPQARAHVTTQSATKIYRMNSNYARASTEITVDADGYLEFLPDPTILYRNARFHQTINIDLREGATALLSDIVVPGRIARDEFFEFDHYYSSIQARHTGTPILTDTRELAPDSMDPKRPGLLDGYLVFGSLYVLSGELPSEDLNDEFYQRLGDRTAVDAASSVLPYGKGVVLRVLGETAQDVQSALYEGWDEARSVLFGVNRPRIRKY